MIIGSLKRLWTRPHYKIGFYPVNGMEETSSVLHDKARALKTETEILTFVGEIFKTQEPFLKTKNVSGFYSSQTFFLANRYQEFMGDIKSFVYCYYPLIISHLFIPCNRMYEQHIFVGHDAGSKLEFLSTLTQIENDLIACYLYSSANRLGRRKYLRYFNAPFVTEVLKGLEYLSKLYYIKIDNYEIGITFKNFLREFSELEADEIEALWEFRCGLIHRGTLYNVNSSGRVYRFAYGWDTHDIYVIRHEEVKEGPFLEGAKYTINCEGLFKLYLKAKLLVEKDMVSNYKKYVLSTEFPLFIQRHWTMQYLPTVKEVSGMFESGEKENDHHWDLLAAGKAKLADCRIILLDVPITYIWKLKFKQWKEDFLSRIRDLLAP